ncbi:paramyosin-like [Mya arenaria]|uniref:paramyosin-like n=1 Tax=Mya arenaria TaxID=6604 RepID=UPI0022E3AD03|nr:paramyosin-like [Mya arenaria]
MANLTARYPEAMDRNDPPPDYYELEKDKQRSLVNLDHQIRSTVVELEDAKQELLKVKAFNITIEKKIDSADGERKSLEAKLDSLRAKLAVSNANVSKFNDDKETLRTNLNESQVLVARLEERLTASSSELDRMRDPANPESTMAIRKHIVHDKKEIKKLKVEVETEHTNLESDKTIATDRDNEIKKLEKEQSKLREQLQVCQEERAHTLEEEAEERRMKEEIVRNYKLLKEDRKTYEQRLKDAKILLGVKVSGENVGKKMSEEMKDNEKQMQKQFNNTEKRLKDALAVLDILRNQHKMSKTAMSINKYTTRNKDKRGAGSVSSSDSKVSVAMNGPGPVRFATKTPKGLEKTVGSLTDRPKQSDRASDGVKKAGTLTERSSTNAAEKQPKGLLRRESVAKGGEKKNSVQFVPPPKSKLTGGKPR